MSVIIAETIKELRTKKGVSQETLAEAMQVSMQAVSKWENNISCPDIALLPKLAEYFEVTIDYLVIGKQMETIENGVSVAGIPNDDKIRVVQLRGNQVMQSQDWDKNMVMKLELPELFDEKMTMEVEVLGDCVIQGDVNGSMSVNGDISCGNVGGNVTANGDVNCGNIGGSVNMDGDINCGNIGGNVKISGDIRCGNVNGGVTADGDVSCGDVRGSVTAQGDVTCKEIYGNVKCDGDIEWRKDR